MLRYEVENYIGQIEEPEKAFIEIEEDFKGTLLYGLNISIENENEDYLANISLSYEQVLEVYKMLTEKICGTQIQTLDIMQKKRKKEILNGRLMVD